MTIRVSREPERPRRLHRNSGWGDRNRQLPGPRWDAPGRGEQTTGDTVVSAREEFEPGRDGRRGVGTSHSIVEPGGTIPRDPVERRGRHVMTPLEGTHGGCIETHNRVHEPTTVAESRKSGVGWSFRARMMNRHRISRHRISRGCRSVIQHCKSEQPRRLNKDFSVEWPGSRAALPGKSLIFASHGEPHWHRPVRKGLGPFAHQQSGQTGAGQKR